MKETKKIIKGFGPSGLVREVREIGWELDDKSPTSKTFRGIAIGGYSLTNFPDDLCSQKYTIIIKETGKKCKVVVTGYSTPHLLEMMKGVRSIQLGSKKDSYLGKALRGYRLYQITVILV